LKITNTEIDSRELNIELSKNTKICGKRLSSKCLNSFKPKKILIVFHLKKEKTKFSCEILDEKIHIEQKKYLAGFVATIQ